MHFQVIITALETSYDWINKKIILNILLFILFYTLLLYFFNTTKEKWLK